ncbi:MAG: hypothetical protein HFI13_07430 [Lachnospiraceae bacterium]|nr:hypothetical protein [Lachnospiraceae bacterium]
MKWWRNKTGRLVSSRFSAVCEGREGSCRREYSGEIPVGQLFFCIGKCKIIHKMCTKHAENKEKKLAIGRDFIIIVNRSAKAAVLFQKGKRIRL